MNTEEHGFPSAGILAEDYDLQDIICLNLERAVQGCVDLAAHVIADADLPAPTTMAISGVGNT